MTLVFANTPETNEVKFDARYKYTRAGQSSSSSRSNQVKTKLMGQIPRFASYLNGVVVRLARFAVGLVGHEPGLQQVLVETVAKPSDRGVICRDGWKERRR